MNSADYAALPTFAQCAMAAASLGVALSLFSRQLEAGMPKLLALDQLVDALRSAQNNFPQAGMGSTLKLCEECVRDEEQKLWATLQ